MVKISVIFALLAVILLSAGAWAVDEQLIYTGDYVSVGSTTKLCAHASDDGGLVGVPNVGVWFQAWTLAGIPRFPGPSQTLFTNSIGNVCTLKTLNTGLYTVQAFGATGNFDGVASMPVVVGSLTPRSGNSGLASAGIGMNESPSGPRQVALGLLFQTPREFFTTPLPGGRQMSKVGSAPMDRHQVLILDQDNPDGPTRIVSMRPTLFAVTLYPVPPIGASFFRYHGFCDIQIGDSMRRAFLTLEMNIGFWGKLTPTSPMTPNFKITGDGMFAVNVMALNGQNLYRAYGDFTGQTGFAVAPP